MRGFHPDFMDTRKDKAALLWALVALSFCGPAQSAGIESIIMMKTAFYFSRSGAKKFRRHEMRKSIAAAFGLLLTWAGCAHASVLVAGTQPDAGGFFFTENDASEVFSYEQIFTLSTGAQLTGLSINAASFNAQTLSVELFSGLGMEGTGTLLHSFDLNIPGRFSGYITAINPVTVSTSLYLGSGTYSPLLSIAKPSASGDLIYEDSADSIEHTRRQRWGERIGSRCIISQGNIVFELDGNPRRRPQRRRRPPGQFWDGKGAANDGQICSEERHLECHRGQLDRRRGRRSVWRSGSAAPRRTLSSTPGTVTLGGPISAAGLTFQVDGYVIAGGSALTLVGPTPTLTMNGSATISAPIAGKNGLIENGPGKLTLTNGSNSYSGGTTVAGALQVGTASAAGSSSARGR